MKRILLILAAVALLVSTLTAATGEEVQERVDHDLAAGRPVVVHVVVALCDNANQGIVPVSAELGNGQDPRSNLYWGALYGVKTHLPRKGGWKRLSVEKPADTRILERGVFRQALERKGKTVPVYVVADAWDGAHIRSAIAEFLEMAAGFGGRNRIVTARDNGKELALQAGGGAHLVAFVGHNGLMDFTIPTAGRAEARQAASSSIVLACASKPYFLDRLEAAGSHPLLLTNGLMAPEAYTLDAAIKAWVAGGNAAEVLDAAAVAYDRYQKCGVKAARRLFSGQP